MSRLTERLEYGRYCLDVENLELQPIKQLGRWWQDALDAKVLAIDAVHLATVDEHCRPDGRIVLLKEFDEKGLVFFTNYESQKACQLTKNPSASMTLFWPLIERQVRVRGQVQRCLAKESQAYFDTRPRGAQLSAWASRQSKPVASREELEQSYETVEKRFLGQNIPCPTHWGGYRLQPSYFEFWQGRANRLHDRFCYRLLADRQWHIERLMP